MSSDKIYSMPLGRVYSLFEAEAEGKCRVKLSKGS